MSASTTIANQLPDGTIWCMDCRGKAYGFNEFLEAVKHFHGYAAPGLVIGGKMIHAALEGIPNGTLFDALCEIGQCLPDAVQLLTPCTIGNGWLKILPFFKYAVTLYDKYTGSGIRVSIDAKKVASWAEINTWFFKLKPKQEQDTPALLEQICAAGANIMNVQPVQVSREHLVKHEAGIRRVCPICKEAFPARHGGICRACQGRDPFAETEAASVSKAFPTITRLPVTDAVGKHALHDMTQVVPKTSKGPVFLSGQEITTGDICRLQTMGKQYVYVTEDSLVDEKWVHENTVAVNFAKAMAGEGIAFSPEPKEGKVDFVAERDGLLVVDADRLEAFNLIPNVMCATRKGYSVVAKGRKLGGTRAIPLYLDVSLFSSAMDLLNEGPILKVLPMRKANIGILVTGTEIYEGLVEDKFIPTITAKAIKYGCRIAHSVIVPDDKKAIKNGITDLFAYGADLIVTTAGLSVDPDDVTREGLEDAGAGKMLYGAPILPGAMTLLTQIDDVPVIGVPACALFHQTTSFDVLVPRILSGVDITRRDLSKLGHGAFCWNCKVCRYPKCSFGKA